MPEIDVLMQEWPAEFEDMLNEVGLNTFRCLLLFLLNTNLTHSFKAVTSIVRLVILM